MNKRKTRLSKYDKVINRSVYFLIGTIVCSWLWAIVGKCISVTLPASCLHIAPIDLLFLSAHSAPGLILFFVKSGDHRFKVRRGIVATMSSLVDWLLGRLSAAHLILFLDVLVGNYAFLNALIFVGHFLNVLPHFENPTSQTLIHLTVA